MGEKATKEEYKSFKREIQKSMCLGQKPPLQILMEPLNKKIFLYNGGLVVPR